MNFLAFAICAIGGHAWSVEPEEGYDPFKSQIFAPRIRMWVCLRCKAVRYQGNKPL